MSKNRSLPVDRKASVYLDEELQKLISDELRELWSEGHLDYSVGDLIKKRLRESYGIPGVKINVKR